MTTVLLALLMVLHIDHCFATGFFRFRVLGFYRVPPTSGRRVNMTYDLKRLADHKLAKTFFKSPGKNDLNTFQD